MSKRIAEIISIPDPLRNNQERIQFSFRYWCEKGKFGRKKFEKRMQKTEHDELIKVLEKYIDFDIGIAEFIRQYLDEVTKKDKFPPADREPEITKDFLKDSIKYKLRINRKSRVGGYLNETDNVFYIRWFAPHHD